jgi:hypothetical protein
MYVNPKDAKKVQERRAAAYGKAPVVKKSPNKKAAAAAMAKIAKVSK